MLTKPTLIYVNDPLCGWCFGFHSVMEKLAVRFKDQLRFKVIAGGLAIEENAQTINEGYSFIRDAFGRVEQTTGVTFGENFKLLAEEGSYLIDSMPGSVAQTVVNEVAPDFSLTFAGKMQHALYVDGKDLNKLATFQELLADTPVPVEEFSTLYNSDKIREKTIEQFEWCKKVGASAFPALLLEIGNEIGLMTKGYRPYDTLESHLHHILNNFEKLSS